MAKKDVCKYCGARNPEHECKRCGKSICSTHSVYFDVGMRLEQRTALGLTEIKEHPAFHACLTIEEGEGVGCALLIAKAMMAVAKGKKVTITSGGDK